MSVSRRMFLSQAGTVTAAVVLSQPQLLAAPAAHAAASSSLGCSLLDEVETIVERTFLAVARLHAENPGLPGFTSFDRYFEAAYPEWLSEEDSTLLLGALYLKSIDAARSYIETPSAEETCTQLAAELPTDVLGPDYFRRLLEHAQRQVAVRPETLTVYREAAARTLALTDLDALTVYGPPIDKIRRAAYVAGVIVGVLVRIFL